MIQFSRLKSNILGLARVEIFLGLISTFQHYGIIPREGEEIDLDPIINGSFRLPKPQRLRLEKIVCSCTCIKSKRIDDKDFMRVRPIERTRKKPEINTHRVKVRVKVELSMTIDHALEMMLI